MSCFPTPCPYLPSLCLNLLQDSENQKVQYQKQSTHCRLYNISFKFTGSGPTKRSRLLGLVVFWVVVLNCPISHQFLMFWTSISNVETEANWKFRTYYAAQILAPRTRRWVRLVKVLEQYNEDNENRY